MSVFESVIAWLAPPECIGCGQEGATLCEACGAAELISYGERCFDCGRLSPMSRSCEKCRAGSPRHVVIAVEYQGAAQRLIKAYKFKHRRSAAEELSSVMAAVFQSYLNSASFSNLNYMVIGVPSASVRNRERGFDHIARLTKSLSTRLKMENCHAVGRFGSSQQVGARRADRLKQPKGQYFVSDPAHVRGRNILLIDDVLTTGATIREVTKVLRNAGAKRIDALVFAKKI